MKVKHLLLAVLAQAFILSMSIAQDASLFESLSDSQVVVGTQGPIIESIWAAPDTITVSDTTTLSVVASDPDGDVLTYTWSMASGSGAATITPADAAVTDAAFSAPGSYILEVVVSDGINSVHAEVTVTVIADWDPQITITSHSDGGQVPAGQDVVVTTNASDNSGIAKVHLWSKETQTTSWTYHGADTASPYAWNIGVLPVGSYQLNAKAVTNDGESVVTSITIEVVSVNNPPTANNQSIITAMNTQKDFILTGTDPDGDMLVFSIISSPSHGTLVGVAPNMTYTPDAGFVGNDSFTFKVNDGLADSTIATVSATVTGSGDPTVTITSHSDGDAIPAGQDVVVTANASDDSGIAKVHFWSKETQATNWTYHGADTASPYAWNIGVLPVGSYQLNAKAIANDGGTVITTTTINVYLKNSYPVITAMGVMPDTILLGDSTTASVEATDADGDVLTYKWFMRNGPGSAIFASPDAATTEVTFTAAGYYALGITVSDGKTDIGRTLAVTVVLDTQPEISITTLTVENEELNRRDLIVTVDASHDTGIADVTIWTLWELSDEWDYYMPMTEAPYQWNLGDSLPNGRHRLIARAISNNGVEVSKEISITVYDNFLVPTIHITSHADWDVSWVPASEDVIITLNASHDSGIEKVNLWSKERQAADYTWHGQVTTDPYEWNLGKLPVGDYTMTTKAVANNGTSSIREFMIIVEDR